jgi:hypothetical protein
VQYNDDIRKFFAPRYTSNNNKKRMVKTFTLENLMLQVESEDLFKMATNDSDSEPRQQVIDVLLRYSRSLEVNKSSYLGHIEQTNN